MIEVTKRSIVYCAYYSYEILFQHQDNIHSVVIILQSKLSYFPVL